MLCCKSYILDSEFIVISQDSIVCLVSPGDLVDVVTGYAFICLLVFFIEFVVVVTFF